MKVLPSLCHRVCLRDILQMVQEVCTLALLADLKINIINRLIILKCKHNWWTLIHMKISQVIIRPIWYYFFDSFAMITIASDNWNQEKWPLIMSAIPFVILANRPLLIVGSWSSQFDLNFCSAFSVPRGGITGHLCGTLTEFGKENVKNRC